MIDFSMERWSEIRRVYGGWWDHSLVRPVIFVTSPCPVAPMEQKHFGDKGYSTDWIAGQIVAALSQKSYLGDAYPYQSMDFSGPGVAAAYLGARPSLSQEGRIWFYPMENRPDIENLHLRFDPNNFWFCRTVEIIRKVKSLSGANMVLGFPDLGGVMDILSSFFPSEELFFAMADTPQEVERLVLEIEAAWFEMYERLCAEMEGFQGYSDWSGLYSRQKSYIHQCDFSYMIGPKDFDRFVLPTLKREFSRIDHSIYHLDGKGEIQHLDKLLACRDLQAVQWVPGDGGGLHEDYPQLLKRILDSGRGTYVWGGRDNLKRLRELLGGLKGIYMRYDLTPGENFENTLKEIGIRE